MQFRYLSSILPYHRETNLSAKSKNESAIPEESLEIGVLIEKCAQGDISALQEFFQQYSLDIYNFPIRVFYLSEDEASDFFLYAFVLMQFLLWTLSLSEAFLQKTTLL